MSRAGSHTVIKQANLSCYTIFKAISISGYIARVADELVWSFFTTFPVVKAATTAR